MSTFQFKHFSVRQTHTAMKVGTDAMVLGALCLFEEPASILDIGTGTGVLSLMAAQRFQPEQIVAVELDPSAAEDARFNFSQASFPTQLEVLELDIRAWQTDRLFDGIITNPPFFEQSSKSDSAERNRARHTDELPFGDLMDCCSRLLTGKGLLWMIVPASAQTLLEALGIARGLYLQQVIDIHGKPGTPVRVVLAFGKQEILLQQSQFAIRNTDGSYTDAYIRLTCDFHNIDLSLNQRP